MKKEARKKIDVLDKLNGYETLLHDYESKVNPEDNHLFAKIEAAISNEEILDYVRSFFENTRNIKAVLGEEREAVFKDLSDRVEHFKEFVDNSLSLDNENVDGAETEVEELLANHVDVNNAKLDAIDLISGKLDAESDNALKYRQSSRSTLCCQLVVVHTHSWH